MLRFRGRVSKDDSGGYAVPLPTDARLALGRARAPVRATVNGHTFRTTLARYGEVDYLGFNRGVRDAAGIADGDLLSVELQLDTEPRAVEVPEELAQALAADDQARAAFEALAASHRREYAGWIAEAKRPETRARRAGQAVERLRAASARPAGGHD